MSIIVVTAKILPGEAGCRDCLRIFIACRLPPIYAEHGTTLRFWLSGYVEPGRDLRLQLGGGESSIFRKIDRMGASLAAFR
jgi:hypothetical protein